MNKRRQIVVDKKFQFKSTLYIIGIATFIAALIVGAIAVNVVYNNRKIEKIYTDEDKNILYLQIKCASGKMEELDNKAMKDVAVSHSGNLKLMNSIMKYNKILLVLLIVFLILQGVAMGFIFIRKTHRIAGPIFVMTRYMQEIIAGKYPQVRELRKKDELKDFYAVFSTMVEALKKRNN